MHSSLAVAQEGLPLGWAAVKFWNRAKFKGTAQLKRKINPARVPIEGKESVRWLENLRDSVDRLGRPDRCIHVGDRESDIYELYCLTKELGTHFVVRTVVDRLAGDCGHTVSAEMRAVQSAGTYHIEVRGEDDEITRVCLDVWFKQIRVLPPIDKQQRYPPLVLSVIRATAKLNRTGFVGGSNFQIGWSDDEQISDEQDDEQIFSRGAGTGGADGAGARGRTLLALDSGAIDRREDRLLGAHVAGMGEEGRGQ
ncbi:hypothetical protein ACETRX_35265 [Labrys portucalensis]|uniref:Uncharacterized protein n=2 Tax=Labrys neptuniae TaxID=376174 RepID=A0ABV6ZRS5_9HYPH